MKTFENDAILLVGSEKGIYNWQHAANTFSVGNTEGLDVNDYLTLKSGPDNPEYTDVIDHMCSFVKYHGQNGIIYYFAEVSGGDIYLVPEGVDVPEC